MKKLKSLWRLLVLFALVATLSLSYVQRSRAFTLIELQLLPAVQLIDNQAAAVEVSNISSESVDVVVSLFMGDGSMLLSKSATIVPGRTLTVPYKQAATGAGGLIRGVVASSTANAVVSDIMTFDKASGEVVAILPYVESSPATTQLVPAVQLVAGQVAALAVVNDGTAADLITVSIIGADGKVVHTKTVTLAAGGTYFLPFMNNQTGNTRYRAQVNITQGDPTKTVSDIMTFDKTSGEIIAVLK